MEHMWAWFRGVASHPAVVAFLYVVALRLRGVAELQRAGVDVKPSQFSGERCGNQFIILYTLNTQNTQLFKLTNTHTHTHQ